MKKTLLLLSGLAVFAACNTDKTQTTKSGFEYEITKDEDGDNIKPGDVAEFDALIHIVNSETGKDSLVADTKEMSDTPQKFPIPSQEELDAAKGKEPLIEFLLLLSKGDEGHVSQKFDTIPQLAEQFPGYDKIRYTVKVLNVLSKEEFEAEMEAANAIEMEKKAAVQVREPEVADLVASNIEQYKSNSLTDVKEIDGGTKIYTIEEGSGEMYAPGDLASVHYYGVLLSNGQMFDNSFSRGEPIEFPVGTGQVIPGWDTGLMQLKKGSKALLVIPSAQAYGEAGSPPAIAPNEDLVFYVELGN